MNFFNANPIREKPLKYLQQAIRQSAICFKEIFNKILINKKRFII